MFISRFINSSSEWLHDIFASTPTPDLGFEEAHSFDTEAWKTYYNIDVANIPIPQSLLSVLDEPCPFWKTFKIRQTHLLCLIPGGITTRTLWDTCASTHLSPSLEDQIVPKEPYWILITKRTLPGSGSKTLQELRNELEGLPYYIPTILEASAAVVALRASNNVIIYPLPAGYTRCEEKVSGLPVAIGSQGHNKHILGTQFMSQAGIAVVRKAKD